MNLDRTIRCLARTLTGALAACLAWAAAPAALATPRPGPPGWNKHPPVPAGPHTALRYPPGWNKHPPLPAHPHLAGAAGLPGWQITLIAAAAVLLAALVVTAYRIRTTRRRVATTA
jgi:hypothetical protein